MLASMLLHVFATAFRVNAAMNRGAWQRQFRRRFQIVNDPAVLRIHNFRDSQALGSATASIEREQSGVVNLAAAGGIERGFPQNDGRTRLLRRERRDALNHRIEFVQFRTVVVKAFGHDEKTWRQRAESKRAWHRRSTAHERARYRCFLPDLAGLAGKRRAEPMPDSTY